MPHVANLFYRLGLDGAAIANGLVMLLEVLALLVFIIVRDRRLVGTPEQTWHGWCVPACSDCTPVSSGCPAAWHAYQPGRCRHIISAPAQRNVGSQSRLLSCTKLSEASQNATCRTLQAFSGWWGYLCLAAPSAAMIIVEWSTFEVWHGCPKRDEALLNVRTCAHAFALSLCCSGVSWPWLIAVLPARADDDPAVRAFAQPRDHNSNHGCAQLQCAWLVYTCVSHIVCLNPTQPGHHPASLRMR